MASSAYWLPILQTPFALSNIQGNNVLTRSPRKSILPIGKIMKTKKVLAIIFPFGTKLAGNYQNGEIFPFGKIKAGYEITIIRSK